MEAVTSSQTSERLKAGWTNHLISVHGSKHFSSLGIKSPPISPPPVFSQSLKSLGDQMLRNGYRKALLKSSLLSDDHSFSPHMGIEQLLILSANCHFPGVALAGDWNHRTELGIKFMYF